MLGKTIPKKKKRLWCALNFPAIAAFFYIYFLPDNYQVVIEFSGLISATLLACILLLNPLVAVFPKQLWFKKINRHRQVIGITMFVYACVHVFAFYTKRGSFQEFVKFLSHPIVIPGLIAFLICLLLALTSNKASMQNLGFNNWKKLHRAVYVAQFAVFMHMFLLEKKALATLGIVVVTTFQLLRYRKKKIIKAQY